VLGDIHRLWPVTNARVNLESTDDSGLVLRGVVGVEMQRRGVLRQQGEPRVVGSNNGSPQRVLVHVADNEVFEVAAMPSHSWGGVAGCEQFFLDTVGHVVHTTTPAVMRKMKHSLQGHAWGV
jgi:hypothetical protein